MIERTMRARAATGLLFVLALLACGRKAHGTNDEPSGGAASDGAASSPDGVNAKDIERFADEQKIDHEPAKLTQLATVRVSPPRGEPIVNIQPGTDVQKLATHGDALLVSFTSPKTGDKTMGWIPTSALAPANVPALNVPGAGTATAPHALAATTSDGGAKDAGALALADAGGAHADAGKGAAHKSCAAGQELAKILDEEVCLKTCKSQADCPTKTFCTSGVLADPPGRTAKLCFKVSN
jgi:hypothetical protein